MMMGTGETNAERIEHLRMIRDVQDRTGGFRSFIPWTYQPENNHLKGRTQATSLEYLRLIAVARLFFDNVAHLQSSWLTTGKDVGQLSLHMGVDDLGSIMLEENVISSAGARHRSNLHDLVWLIRSAGRIPAQRDTLYRHLRVHWTPADDPTDERVRSHFSSIALPVADRPLAAARRRRREPRLAGQGAARGRGDVRRRGRRYDRTNTVLSFGQDRAWRRATRRGARPAPGERCLDLAAGTGVSTEELARSGALVVGRGPVAGHARRWAAGPAGGAAAGRRRAGAAVRRRARSTR